MDSQQAIDFVHEKVFSRIRSLENKSIVVFGGTGFFGKALANFVTRWRCLKPNAPNLIIKTRADISKILSDPNELKTATHLLYMLPPGVCPRLLSLLPDCRVLYTSSGAAQNPDRTEYAKTKFEEENVVKGKAIIARFFSSIGPELDPMAPFAFTSIVRQLLPRRGEHNATLALTGDGKAVRSYLYSADLAAWILVLLAEGKLDRTYQVGSDKPIDVRTLAEVISAKLGIKTLSFIYQQGNDVGKAGDHYVPNISFEKNTFGLDVFTPLDSAVGLSLRV